MTPTEAREELRRIVCCDELVETMLDRPDLYAAALGGIARTEYRALDEIDLTWLYPSERHAADDERTVIELDWQEIKP